MIIDEVYQNITQKKLEYSLLLFGVLLLIGGVLAFKIGVKPTTVEGANQTIKQSPILNKIIYVDVAGAVEQPGVVGLVLGSRVGEAIASAGGVTAEADTDWISQNLNQAKILTDGEKIYIPSRKSENIVQSSISNVQSGRININMASESELDSLPGVGPVTAGKIISGRPYASIEELVEKKVVTAKVFEQIRDLIITW